MSDCPSLKLISQRSVYPHIDIDTCTRLGIDRVVEPASRHAVLRHGRDDLGADPRRHAADSAADGLAQGRQLADGRGHDDPRQDARHLRLRPHRQRGRGLRQGVRHERAGLGARSDLGAGARRRLRHRAQQGGVLRDLRHHHAAHAAGRGDAPHRQSRRSRAHETDGAPGQHQPRAADRTGRAGRMRYAPAGPAWRRSMCSRTSRCAT